MSDRDEVIGLLESALEVSPTEIVLLDSGLHVRVINNACRHMWRVDPALGLDGLHYGDLLRLVGRNRTPPPSDDEVEAYVRERVALVAAGTAPPRDIRRPDGMVIRSTCQTLPAGGRMLVYTDITDLVQLADRLEELAITDELTGLHNRRHFETLARAEWIQHKRHNRPVSVLMIDIDHFKHINDTLGHNAGDDVLREIATRCLAQVRGSDVVARYGGEEFVVLLPDASLADASLVADRLRHAVARRPIMTSGGSVDITISVGVADTGVSSESGDIAEVTAAADAALYRAKRAGRNRVRAASSDGADVFHVTLQ